MIPQGNIEAAFCAHVDAQRDGFRDLYAMARALEAAAAWDREHAAELVADRVIAVVLMELYGTDGASLDKTTVRRAIEAALRDIGR